MTAIKIMHAANIIVAGGISITSIFNPKPAAVPVFSNAYSATELMRLLRCLWLEISILPLTGLYRPMEFLPVPLQII